MATVTRYVDPDASGSGTGADWTNAYTSLNAWEAAEQTDLVTDGDTHVVYCKSSSGGDDTTTVDITGWTTGSSNDITISQDDFPSDGILDTTKYNLYNNDADAEAINIGEDYVTVDKLQIRFVATSSNSRRGLFISLQNAASLVWLNKVIVSCTSTSTTNVVGITINEPDLNIKISNCLIYDVVNGSNSAHRGINSAGVSTAGIYNTTIHNCYDGIRRVISGTVTVTNCAIGNCTDDINGTVTASYCCTDDGDGTNAQNPSGSDWDNEFTDKDNDDFSLVSGGNCVGNGTDDPGSGLYSDDIIGTARSSTWDIGAFEYVAAGANVPQKWHHHSKNVG